MMTFLLGRLGLFSDALAVSSREATSVGTTKLGPFGAMEAGKIPHGISVY